MAEPINPFQTGTLSYVRYLTPSATWAASIVGVNTRAVVGAIANEYDTRLNPDLTITMRGLYAQNIADDRILALVNPVPYLQPGSVHEAILSSYNSYKLRGEPELDAFRKQFNFSENLAAIDVGPGNIKISTAIDVLRKYLETTSVSNDPLNLRQFENNYGSFVKDLTSFSGDQRTTAAITALYLKQGENFFQQKDSAAWAQATPEQREALLVTYYKLGERKLSENIDAVKTQAEAEGREYRYNAEGDGGKQHLVNINKLQESIDNPTYQVLSRPRCFPGDTLIALPGGGSKRMDELVLGMRVATFDGAANRGRGALLSGVVTKIFHNVTTEWLRVDFAPHADGSSRRPLIATPGHETLRPEGGFARLDQMVVWNNQGDCKDSGTVTLVNQDGSLSSGSVSRIVYSAATADLFEQTVMMTGGGTAGNTALKRAVPRAFLQNLRSFQSIVPVRFAA